jgi:hypothetical protein
MSRSREPAEAESNPHPCKSKGCGTPPYACLIRVTEKLIAISLCHPPWGEVHTNTIEDAFSLLKRGIYGTFHKVSIKHLGRYCNEFSHRFNRREEQLQMFGMTVRNLVRREVLSYKKLTTGN